MLEQILDFIHNYFIHDKFAGEFSISEGTLTLDLQEGQYFKIIGSVFNDGVHQYPAEELTDETFTGEIWAMAVPPSVVALAGEITEWVAKYGEAANSPFSSESFGGYSYSKGSGTNKDGSSGNPSDWRKVFGSRLNHWRKIA